MINQATFQHFYEFVRQCELQERRPTTAELINWVSRFDAVTDEQYRQLRELVYGDGELLPLPQPEPEAEDAE